MKKFLLIAIIPLFVSDFCDGWDDGYKEGWCYQIDNCIAPVPPVCPTPEVGETRYKDGYNRGFTKGKKDRKK
jgi:hypothetical protein